LKFEPINDHVSNRSLGIRNEAKDKKESFVTLTPIASKASVAMQGAFETIVKYL
jgi:hypothetical protein